MFLLNRGNSISLKTNVEDWMADQQFTEVFDFSQVEVGPDEMQITAVLDGLLAKVLYKKTGIDETVSKMREKNLIQRRQAKTGEQSLGSALGSNYDAQFKELVQQEILHGQLKPFAGKLVVVPSSEKGPDVYMPGSCMVAWDVTSRGDIDAHIKRDVYGRAYNRYYLLIWDSPRTESMTLIRDIARFQQR